MAMNETAVNSGSINAPNTGNNIFSSNFLDNIGEDQRLGYGLVAVGAFCALGAMSGAIGGWLTLSAIAAGFLYTYKKTDIHAFAVPGSIIGGVATGVMLESLLPFDGTGFFMGLAAGFYALSRLEPQRHAWSYYPAISLAGFAAFILAIEHPWFLAIAAIVAGVALLSKNKTGTPSNKSSANDPVAVQTATHTMPPMQVQTVQTVQTMPPAMTAQSTLERLQVWRNATALQLQQPEAEVLRYEQLERLSQLKAEVVDDLFGILDTAQVERYGKELLAIVRI
jgi:hypothetical protein